MTETQTFILFIVVNVTLITAFIRAAPIAVWLSRNVFDRKLWREFEEESESIGKELDRIGEGIKELKREETKNNEIKEILKEFKVN